MRWEGKVFVEVGEGGGLSGDEGEWRGKNACCVRVALWPLVFCTGLVVGQSKIDGGGIFGAATGKGNLHRKDF